MHRTERNSHRAALSGLLAAALGVSALAATPPPDQADARINAELREAIFRHAEFAADEITVQTHDGVVYLHGLVDTSVERDAVENLAKATPGVKRVVNAIELHNVIR